MPDIGWETLGRIAWGALKLNLELIYQADFQDGSCGCCRGRSAYDAVDHVWRRARTPSDAAQVFRSAPDTPFEFVKTWGDLSWSVYRCGNCSSRYGIRARALRPQHPCVRCTRKSIRRPFERPIDGGSRDAEYLSQVRYRISAGAIHAPELSGPAWQRAWAACRAACPWHGLWPCPRGSACG